MNTRISMIFSAALLTATMVVAWPVERSSFAQEQTEPAAGQEASATHDIVYMRDGRELRGKVLSETRLLVVFEYLDPALQVKTKMTLLKENIIKIDRDVAAEAAPATAAPATQQPSRPSSAPTNNTRTYGISRVQSASQEVPSIYVVPLKGQMGTDIRSDLYKSIIEDIKAQKPSVVVLEVNCSDTSEMMFPEGYETPAVPPEIAEQIRQREWGMLDLEDYRELIHMFRDGLREFPQVVWIHDSDGIAATVFMAWDKIYMSPNARLGSKISFLAKTGAASWQDSDVRAKMIAAWMGIATGFLEKGGYSVDLARAMLEPSSVLSCDWKGRAVEWRLDDKGAYTVDTSDKHTTYFRAKTAEDFCLSQGTAEDMNDLALLLGYREYRLIESKDAAAIEQYVKDWRKTYEDTQKWFRDYQQHMGWAGGGETLKWLGRAKLDIEKIVSAMNRYKAVEIRWEQDFGVPKIALEILLEQMKEQLQALKRSSGGGGGGRGPQRGGGGGRTLQ